MTKKEIYQKQLIFGLTLLKEDPLSSETLRALGVPTNSLLVLDFAVKNEDGDFVITEKGKERLNRE